MASHIIELRMENFKRVSAAHIVPEGGIVEVAGRNGQGKSSVLDAIWAALGGKRACPLKPVKDGEAEGYVELKLDGIPDEQIPPLKVRRTFYKSGKSELTVVSEDGYAAPSPQALLDGMFNLISFDPLAFTRLKPADQASELLSLLGLDFTEHDRQRKELYDQRTAVNRTVKSLKAQLDASALYEDVPSQPLSASELADELNAAMETNRQNREAREAVEDQRKDLADFDRAYRDAFDEVVRLEKALEQARKNLKQQEQKRHEAETMLVEAEKDLAELQDVDLEPIRMRMQEIDSTNAKVRANQEHHRIAAAYKEQANLSDELTDQIEALDEKRHEMITTANWPLPGLGFDESGVTLNGLPFAQASQAEQLQASVAIGLAMNPKVKVLLCRDASLLDDDAMELIAKLAEEHDAQLWLERVGQGSPGAVLMEDGTVVEPAQA